MEKSTAYVLCCLRTVLSRPEFAPGSFKYLTVWSDGPKQFKSKTWIGTLGFDVLVQWRFLRVNVNFFCPKHGKQPCDMEFSCVNSIKKNAAAQRPLKELQDVVKTVHEHFRKYVEIHGESCCKTSSIQHFLAAEKSTVELTAFTTTSLMGIAQSFAYSITANDVKRRFTKNGLRAKHNRNELTGLTIRNHGITGAAV